MKYKLLIIMGLSQMTSLGATQFKSWQEHINYHLQKQNTKQQSGPINFVTVGFDNACDYRVGNRIQNAINDNHQELRIVTDTYLENIVISDRSIILKGGYANCTDAAADISDGDQAVVDAGSVGAVLSITSNVQRETIEISNMIFQNGLNGISIIDADLELGLFNVFLSNNNGGLSAGGGLQVIDGNTDILGTDLLIASNTAWFGGGLLCSGENNSVLINKEEHFAGISLNQATNGYGGGAWVTDGCVLSVYAGSTALLDLGGITGNSATGHGGGVAVTDGGQVNLLGFQFCFGAFCIGNDDEPINLTANTADSDLDGEGDGGAIYAEGEGSLVYAITVDVNSNEANNGGGFAIENFASLESYYEKPNCWSAEACNQMRGNKANLVGGAFYIDENSVMNIGPSLIQQNRADFGTVAYITGDSSNLTLEGSVVTGNGDNSKDGFIDYNVFMVNGTGYTSTSLILKFNTIADNDVDESAIGNLDAAINLLSSIVHETNGADVYTTFANNIDILDCLILHEDSSISGTGATDVIVQDPEFINRAAGDFRLNAMTSPAVDTCDDFLAEPMYRDLGHQLRGWDDPSVINFSGPYDMGAYEAYGNDIIFRHGFED